MTMLMACFYCGLDDTHDILFEYVNDMGETLGYRLHCMSCEGTWNEIL